MTTLREAAQQALEVLENDVMQRTFAGGVRISNAALALRAALAEPVQEPVGEVEQIDIDDAGQASAWFRLNHNVELGDRLYTTPPPPLNLSDPAVQKRLAAQWGYVKAEPVQTWACPEAPGTHRYAKPGHCEDCGKELMLVEPPPEAQTEAEKIAYAAGWWKALEVNRKKQAEPVQEPVAHLWQHSETGRTRVVMPDQIITADAGWLVIGPLYLAPPQRKPLTEEEIVDIWAGVSIDYDDQINIIEMARAIERAHGIGADDAKV